MIFTIGHRESYERYFAEQGRPQKRGRDGDCVGGSVWRTKQEALAMVGANPGWSVYGVLADWDTQTAPSPLGQWHDLLVDADLVRLDGDSPAKSDGDNNDEG